ncbi:hypothetical protein YC2023_123710 [Brassica napus]
MDEEESLQAVNGILDQACWAYCSRILKGAAECWRSLERMLQRFFWVYCFKSFTLICCTCCVLDKLEDYLDHK